MVCCSETEVITNNYGYDFTTERTKMNKGKITISRPCSSREDEIVSLRIYDSKARIEFVEVEIGLANMMQAITGLGNVACEFKTRGLENVGKTIESKTLEFEFESDCKWQDRDTEAYKKACEVAPDGWHPSGYFGSKDSFFYKDNVRYARTQMSRWI